MAEAWRNLTAVGARPLAVTDNLNFGNPERPPIMGQLVGCVEGMGAACRALDFPVVSGNVSLYNETDGEAILPTPTIGGVGLLDDLSARTSPAFKAAGETILLIGETEGHLGATLYLREIHGREDGPPPPVDLDAERRNGDFVRLLIAEGRITACHDVSDGGLIVAVAEMAMAGRLGADLDAPPPRDLAGWLFGEDQARYVVTTADPDAVAALAKSAGVSARPIGRTGGDTLTLQGQNAISVADMLLVNEGWMPHYMAAVGTAD